MRLYIQENESKNALILPICKTEQRGDESHLMSICCVIGNLTVGDRFPRDYSQGER